MKATQISLIWDVELFKSTLSTWSTGKVEQNHRDEEMWSMPRRRGKRFHFTTPIPWPFGYCQFKLRSRRGPHGNREAWWKVGTAAETGLARLCTVGKVLHNGHNPVVLSSWPGRANWIYWGYVGTINPTAGRQKTSYLRFCPISFSRIVPIRRI